MPKLSLQLIGRATVRRSDESRQGIPPSLKPLLGFLSLEPTGHCHRERLITALWPEETTEVGRRRLNTMVWRARKLFGCDRDEVLQVHRNGSMSIDTNRIRIDVVEALADLSRDTCSDAIAGDARAIGRLRQAVRIETEDFLTECYHEWVLQARDRLIRNLLRALETLISIAPTLDQAIQWSELLLRRDPLREDVHRRLIKLYLRAGRRTAALRQYETCRRVLRDELGVEPLPETYLAAAPARLGSSVDGNDDDRLEPVLKQLRDALEYCRTAADHIEQTLMRLGQDSRR